MPLADINLMTHTDLRDDYAVSSAKFVLEESSDDSALSDIVSDWLGEEEPETAAAEKEHSNSNVKVSTAISQSAYIREHLDEFNALCEVEDLDFASNPVKEMENIISTMTVTRFLPGEFVFKEGEESSDLYIVIADQQTAHKAFVEVVREDKVITRLYRGNYFGQMQFLTHQSRVRNASIRAPTLQVSDLSSWCYSLV